MVNQGLTILQNFWTAMTLEARTVEVFALDMKPEVPLEL